MVVRTECGNWLSITKFTLYEPFNAQSKRERAEYRPIKLKSPLKNFHSHAEPKQISNWADVIKKQIIKHNYRA